MDVRWVIDENMLAMQEGKVCGRSVTEAVLTALSMEELENVKHYQDARTAIVTALVDYPKECDILCRMIDNIIADEQSHLASLQKAIAACMGNSAPKAEEYNKAVNTSE